MIRLIALDLDGTLLDPAGQITDETKAAIAQGPPGGYQGGAVHRALRARSCRLFRPGWV